MIPFVSRLRTALAEHRLRARFPRSVIHSGAMASQDSLIGDFAVLFPGASLQSSNLGTYSYVQAGTVISNAEIGPFCSIAARGAIGLAAHPTTMVSTSPVFYDNEQPLPRFFSNDRKFTQNLPRTIIAADVWIGHGVMIKAGVQIGVGAVIGAGSVVTKDVPAYTIVAGMPCRPVRRRFAESVCQRLLESRWWDLPESELQRLAVLFENPENLLAELERGE